MANDPVQYHADLHGKIEIQPKVKVETHEDLSLIYTPGVASVAQEIVQNPHLDKTLTHKGNAVAIITNGTAVLGLGNIGVQAAIPVMEGKAVLFKQLGGVDAYPLVINEKDPEQLIRIITALAPSFAGINLEDIAAPECFVVESRLKETLSIPVFHDDQHGAAIIILAGLFNALRVAHKNIEDIRVVINGAGAAGIATAHLLREAGVAHLTVLDRYGVLHPHQHSMNSYQQALAESTNPSITTDLKDAVADADVFIGLSKGNILTQEMVRSMASSPIIFALANPTPEIMPEQAQQAGASIVATGRSDFPNQINNALVFPGLFRGLLDTNTTSITSSHMIRLSRAIADLVKQPHTHNIVPSVLDSRVASALANTFEAQPASV